MIATPTTTRELLAATQEKITQLYAALRKALILEQDLQQAINKENGQRNPCDTRPKRT